MSTHFQFGHGALQGNLFESATSAGIDRALRAPVAAKNDPATSKQAGAAITRSGQREGQCLGVLALLRQYPRSTSLELAQKGRTYDRYIIARRLPELEQGKLIRKCGMKKCGVSGKLATVWEAL